MYNNIVVTIELTYWTGYIIPVVILGFAYLSDLVAALSVYLPC